MSWQTINKVMGLAMIDKVFAQRLLQEPQETLNAYGFVVTPEELEAIRTCQAKTIPELSRVLLEKFGPQSK